MYNVWLSTIPYISNNLPSFGSFAQTTRYNVPRIFVDVGCESVLASIIFLIVRSILFHLSQFTLHFLVLVGNIF